MTSQRVERLADLLATAWRKRVPVKLASEDRPVDIAEAYAVQDALAARLGFTTAGWKLGMASTAAMWQYGLQEPLSGRLFHETLQKEEGRFRRGDFINPVIEAEFALRLDDDLPLRDPPYGRNTIAAAATMHLAIEVADNRARTETLQPFAIIADNGTGAAFILGPAVADWQDVDYRTGIVETEIDGCIAGPSLSGDARIDPLDIAVWTVAHLTSRGIGLRAGDIISTGSASRPVPLGEGRMVVARFAGLGEVSAIFS